MSTLKRKFSVMNNNYVEEEGQLLKHRRIDIKEEVDILSNCLIKIIEGNEDVTTPEDVALQQQIASASALTQKLNALIADKEEKQRERQIQKREEEERERNQMEVEEIMMENVQLINNVVSTLASSQARLPRAERIKLNQKIQALIMDTVTSHEVTEQLSNEPSLVPANQLFDGLIRYYTEMASYGYEHSPEILANIGSIVAGSAIIGSTIYSPESITNSSGSMLVYLSSYLRTATATASGLYFLQRGGLPIPQILQSVGTRTMQCVETGCGVVVDESNKILNLGLDTLKAYLNQYYQKMAIIYDDDTQTIKTIIEKEPEQESQTSTLSNNSSAKEAEEAIGDILDIPIAERITNLRESLENTMQELETKLPPEEINFGRQDTAISDISRSSTQPEELYGGIIRKSRRRNKKHKSRRGKKGKGKITHKGRKHRKTLKRHKYKIKMRR
jgi:hypothetical protein